MPRSCGFVALWTALEPARARCKRTRPLNSLCARLHVTILAQGKSKFQWIEEGFREYTKRLAPFVTVEQVWVRDEEALVKRTRQERASSSGQVVALDAQRGKVYTSEEFAEVFMRQMEQGGSRVTFVIGGASGLPQAVYQHAHELLSLSTLTFTHQLARLVLMEQIYRAIEIYNHTPYHK
ncbi:hypothetical protein, conserved [Cyanidioschyzon merolae strain 10D]|jgi:23S rRNA (pseudouridine1915-N3)-methyltransferase|uniref:Uncharacterized protein n=1 Tax=Cyanidioschyzon merolae (strain NIES-3377 / 10D) TaxID=280699 RepID=M1V9J6_CYAM1|nr:hypothetical protein, conserved [Cyanidioschyzon merolae strain 10D]BAM81564.1 hypothetical protein, conserved [Cyanidioschyzon merolae strain 10D]|eukprot:XP_005537600.1 hypothetical protein, conserved [Cyanidioschyzon merolae strain 10D]